MALDAGKLGKRALTALIGAAVLLGFVLWLPKWLFHLGIAVLAVLGTLEMAHIVRGFNYKLYKVPVIFATIYGIAAIYIPQLDMAWLPYLVVALTAFTALISPGEMEKCIPRAGISLLGAAYLAMALVSLSWIMSIDTPTLDGRMLFTFCILVVWCGDSAAYLAGSTLGRHRIAPIISPKKTYEGTIANLIGNFLAALLAKAWFMPFLTLRDIVVLSLLFGVLGFFGDLFESLWKRGSNIKDSGNLFPGHGGILDRIDSIFLTAPVFYAYIHYFIEGSGV